MKPATLLLTSVLVLALSSVAWASSPAVEWQFRVLLDDKPVGTHVFEIRDQDGLRVVESEADIDVKFLFFSAYSYQHRNAEAWNNDCLQEIKAQTTINGKEQNVFGERDDGTFRLRTTADKTELPGCIMTFAYWNPSFLQERQLLNAQTGEYLDVHVEDLGEAQIEVRGEARAAKHFRVTAKDTDLEIWYSDANEWLALRSVAKGGRIIRYELI